MGIRFIQCVCWAELFSPYFGCQTPAQHWIKILHLWVQEFYPVLGSGLEKGSWGILRLQHYTGYISGREENSQKWLPVLLLNFGDDFCSSVLHWQLLRHACFKIRPWKDYPDHSSSNHDGRCPTRTWLSLTQGYSLPRAVLDFIVLSRYTVATFRKSYRATPAWMTPTPKPHSPQRDLTPFLTRCWPEFDPILTSSGDLGSKLVKFGWRWWRARKRVSESWQVTCFCQRGPAFSLPLSFLVGTFHRFSKYLFAKYPNLRASALAIGFSLRPIFEASKILYLKVFQSLQNCLV